MKRINIIFNDIRDTLGLTVHEYYILDYIYMTFGNHTWSGIDPNSVGKILGITRAAGVRLLEKLVEDGYAEVVANKYKVTEKWTSIYDNDVKEFYKKIFRETDTWDYIWSVWVKYKSDHFKFKYKSPESEHIAKEQLYNLSGGDLTKAQSIIKRSMVNGWAGLFSYDPGFNHSKNDVSQKIAGKAAVTTFREAAGKADNKFLKNG